MMSEGEGFGWGSALTLLARVVHRGIRRIGSSARFLTLCCKKSALKLQCFMSILFSTQVA
jgi:hypothetical protein